MVVTMVGALGTFWATFHLMSDLSDSRLHYTYRPPSCPHEMAVVFGLGLALALTITGILLWTAKETPKQ
jgi:hypothetical protein